MLKKISGVFGYGSRDEREAILAFVRALGEGRPEARLSLAATSPLASVGEALNAMAAQVAASAAAQRELTGAVCHELRHPLMRLRFRHALVRDASDREDRDQNLERMAEDLDLLDRLAGELLACTQLDATESEPRPEAFAVAPWLATLERQASEAAGARGDALEIEFRVNALELRGEPQHLARAVMNLVANALRFATLRVRVSVESDNGHASIHVDDDGPGVAPEERERVFEAFRRGAPGREPQGFGLGLAIVRRVARRHGGRATVGTSPLGGARFTIAW